MDEFVEAKIEAITLLARNHTHQMAVLKTRNGVEYHVWIEADGEPVIKRLVR